MDKVLKDIFRKNPYFKEINENSFIPLQRINNQWSGTS